MLENLIKKIHESKIYGWFTEEIENSQYEIGPLQEILGQNFKGNFNKDWKNLIYSYRENIPEWKTKIKFVSINHILVICEYLSNKKVFLFPPDLHPYTVDDPFKFCIFDPKINFQFISIFNETLTNGFIGIKFTNQIFPVIYQCSLNENKNNKDSIANISLKLIARDPEIGEFYNIDSVKCVYGKESVVCSKI